MSRLRVAVTIDTEHPDRPAANRTADAILATLAKHSIKGSFFIQGRWAEAEPDSVRAIAGEGHLVGHHSHYHARMPLLTDAGLAADLADGASAIVAAGGPDPRPWFRCPFGAGADDARVLAAVAMAGYRHVGWHVAADDWEPSRSEDVIVSEVVDGVRAHGDGAVVLLHSWPAVTPGALDSIVTRLAALGAGFCRVDELADLPVGVPG